VTNDGNYEHGYISVARGLHDGVMVELMLKTHTRRV
jgi:hypothetical protein